MSGTNLIQLVFWFSLLGLAYIYAGYPLLLAVMNRCCRRSQKPHTTDEKPTLSVIVVANNEAHRIVQKIDSILASDSQQQIIEVLVGSDGSTDQTAQLVDQYPDSRVRCLDFAERRGKPSVLNDTIAQANGEVLILTDARQMLASDAIGKLADQFAEAQVGVVSGELEFRADPDSTTVSDGVGFYWKYEKWIRKSESQFRSVPGATGAFYAIRRSLFQAIDPTTILDDVAIPMQAVTKGYRCLLESGAFAYDTPSSSNKQESARKRRTIAGAAQLLKLYPHWILPWKNPIWWEFVSHKLMRLLSPVLLLSVATTHGFLLSESLYRILLPMHLFVYAAALGGLLFQATGKRSALFGPALMFMSLNVVTARALWDALCGNFSSTWKRVT